MIDQIKVEKFCSLATSPEWQAWLFHFDTDLYRTFIGKLNQSRGCGQNRTIMQETLTDIVKIDNGVKLLSFLSDKFKHVLNKQIIEQTIKVPPVFENFNPTILTFPHRTIISGNDITNQVKQFLSDKDIYDYVIVNGQAYIEYLYRHEAHLKAMIPIKNWLVTKWRAQYQSKTT